ncbi:ribosome silencing factor [Spirochaeta africana]|nr:ribosome silencing factor [Spirochaeta africana]
MKYDTQKIVTEAAEKIAEQAGKKTVALNVSAISGYTDYLIITTVQSHAQLQGLMNMLDDFLAAHDVQTRNPTKRPKDDQWAYVDCGDFVIHIMRPEARTFYELERLWHEAEVVYSQSADA